MTYIKENIITKLQKLYSSSRNLWTGNKLCMLFLKSLCMGDLLPEDKIFIERPVTNGPTATFTLIVILIQKQFFNFINANIDISY